MDKFLEVKFCKGLLTEGLNEIAIKELQHIIAAYSEPHRHYHNINHIFELLKLCDRFNVDSPNTYLAIFYHDVVYNTILPGNEDKSASFAETSLKKMGVSADRIDAIAGMILATKNHLQKTDDPETQLFLDLDFCIVGYPVEQYERYVQAIRQEYSSVPEFLFLRGRKKFLEAAVRATQLFHTAVFENEFGKQAKVNVRHELELLA